LACYLIISLSRTLFSERFPFKKTFLLELRKCEEKISVGGRASPHLPRLNSDFNFKKIEARIRVIA